MDIILCTKEAADDYLMHYRLGGEKKGVRRWQNKDGSLTPEGYKHYAEMYGWGKKSKKSYEPMHIPKTANHNLLDKFGTDPDHNVCYIMGGSGSGKSTVALDNKDKNTVVIHLDQYIDGSGAPEDKIFSKFIKDHGLDPKTIPNGLRKNNRDPEVWRNVDTFSDLIDQFGKAQYGKKRVIVEGVQLMDDTMHPDKEYFKNKPYILLNTSALVSTFRGNRRDQKQFNFSDIQKIANQRKVMQSLKRRLGIKD